MVIIISRTSKSGGHVNVAKLPVVLLQEVPKSQPSVRRGETLDFRAEVYAAFRDATQAMEDFPVRRRVSVLCQQQERRFVG